MLVLLHELSQGGFEFVSIRVENGADFQQAIHEFRPDLILADFKLPTFDGRQALAMAQKIVPEIPLIIISDTAVGIFICDVMGHGVRAALVTAMMHTVFTEIENFAQDQIFLDDVCFVGIEIRCLEVASVAVTA